MTQRGVTDQEKAAVEAAAKLVVAARALWEKPFEGDVDGHEKLARLALATGVLAGQGSVAGWWPVEFLASEHRERRPESGQS